jgi:hypothetical protein
MTRDEAVAYGRKLWPGLEAFAQHPEDHGPDVEGRVLRLFSVGHLEPSGTGAPARVVSWRAKSFEKCFEQATAVHEPRGHRPKKADGLLEQLDLF